MGVSAGTVKSHVSRGLAALAPSGWYAYAPPLGTAVISPYPATSGPALAGIMVANGQVGQSTAQNPLHPASEFVGSARADVAKVVLRVRDSHGSIQLTA